MKVDRNFRCHSLSKITAGELKAVKSLHDEIEAFLGEKEFGINANGNKVKWTDTKQAKLSSLENKLKHSEVVGNFILPKTMQTELRKLHRAEKYGRNFIFTNKYLVKGITQENEAITLYQNFRNAKGIKTFFTKNTERLSNDFISGTWDIPTLPEIQKTKEGFDTKCSWNLDTFPFDGDPLDSSYYAQNQGYMMLTGADKWTTAYCLVNNSEYGVFNEKQKFRYALQCPEEQEHLNSYEEKEEQERYLRMISDFRDIEKMMIFDYDRFVEVNPGHMLEISRAEWYGNGWDIPMQDRVVESVVFRDEAFIHKIKDRVVLCRIYLNSLENDK